LFLLREPTEKVGTATGSGLYGKYLGPILQSRKK
jgi:hypothetical protein